MAFSYKMHSQAIEEYADAYDWYENEQKGLGEQFIAAIDEGVEEICCNPEFYSKLRDTYREVRIKKFPFVISCMNFSHEGSLSILLPYFTPAEIQKQNSEKRRKCLPLHLGNKMAS